MGNTLGSEQAQGAAMTPRIPRVTRVKMTSAVRLFESLKESKGEGT